MRYTTRHVIDTDLDGFWAVCLDETFGQELFRRELKFESYDIVGRETDADGMLRRTIVCTPQLALPAAATKLVGKGTFTEHGRFDPKARIYAADIVLEKRSDILRSSIEVWAEPLADGRCERVQNIENNVKMFGMGKLIERALEQEQRKTHAQTALFMNRWLAERGLAFRPRA